jgi:hypothetical protein
MDSDINISTSIVPSNKFGGNDNLFPNSPLGFFQNNVVNFD